MFDLATAMTQAHNVVSYLYDIGVSVGPSPYTSLNDIPAVDIEGNEISNLGTLTGSKCTLVVNVATY
jgi:hypothetical protein